MIPSGTKFVGINPNFPTTERKSAQNNAAQEVVTMQDIIDTVNDAGGSQTFQQVSDTGGFDNGSTIRQGIAERFLGIRGLELVCVNDKMIQWADGREYYYINNGGVQPVVHCNSLNIDDVPDSTFDETIGFAIGSRYTVLNTGVTYVCTDATVNNAVWENTVKYKVFSALITQSGTSNSLSLTSGATTAGVTYRIASDIDVDFTNVGAPNNNQGTYFIANGGTPNSWGDDGALVYDEGAPIVNILENTLGNIWFNYSDIGLYYIYSESLFTDLKTWNIISNNSLGLGIGQSFKQIQRVTSDLLQIETTDGSYNSSNGVINQTSMEIRVYN
jgi:hypothetical protein